MTDYTWPTEIVPSSSSWQYVSNTAAFVSPLNGVTQTVGRGGDRWACTLVCSNLRGDARAILQAFISRLRGQTHRVVLPNHAYTKRGTQAADVLIKGDYQTGESLIVDGGTPGATIKAGDMIQVYNSPNSALHMVVADATFNGSGEATLSIVPPLRFYPIDNGTVTVLAPKGRFMLAGNSVTWSNEPGGFSSMTIELVEDVVA